jgi:cytochrome c553
MRKKLLSFVAVTAFLAMATSAGTAAAQDAKAGEKKAAMCIGCHGIPGYQASFPEVHKVPMISGQSAKYISSALASYKKNERKHPTMRAIAASLSDQDMADLGAFYAQQAKPGAPTAAASAAAGQDLLAMLQPAPDAQVADLIKARNCLSCHGANFNNPIDPSYPKLAGQHADYLYVALKAYQPINSSLVGRANPVMNGMAAGLTHAQLKDLSRYIASLPGQLQTVAQSRFR